MVSVDLLEILSKKLDEAEQLLLEIEETNDLSLESLFRFELVPLLCKHIPPELCSETKLWERIEEVQSLIENVNWALNHERSANEDRR
jgi:hypothetical protein